MEAHALSTDAEQGWRHAGAARGHTCAFHSARPRPAKLHAMKMSFCVDRSTLDSSYLWKAEVKCDDAGSVRELTGFEAEQRLEGRPECHAKHHDREDLK